MNSKNTPTLTKEMIRNFLSKNSLMTVATSGVFPWIATVYYTFDVALQLYFLSDPSTIHAQHILVNQKVAVAIADSHQSISSSKCGLQLWGIAEQISGIYKVTHALKIWKTDLGVVDPTLTYKMAKGSMFKITPKRIKLFDQKLFKVPDGKEPILEL